MSVDYCLVCVECGEALHFGKSHKVKSEFHKSESYGVSAIGNASADYSLGQRKVLVLLQHFLLRHRQHELRFLPDNVGFVQDFKHWWEYDLGCEVEQFDLLANCLKAPTPGQLPTDEESLDEFLLRRLAKGVEKADERYG